MLRNKSHYGLQSQYVLQSHYVRRLTTREFDTPLPPPLVDKLPFL